MNTNRRQFIKGLSMGLGGVGLFGLTAKEAAAGIKSKLETMGDRTADDVAGDESFWFYVQQSFSIDRSIINLNNGGVHPAPKVVMDALKRYWDFANGAPVLNSWRYLRPRKELIREKLAEAFGCSAEEIAITRNVTESLQIPLLGLELKSGDEVLTTTHDYPSMKNALYQREKREGVRVKTFSFPYPPKSLDVLTERFKENITPRTRLILLCHITNLTGQIFPIRDICRLAREKGIEVVIDGAHAFSHFEFTRDQLECDIYGANCHKWLMGPLGTGFLYVRKGVIPKIWPLFPAGAPLGDDIRKFEHVGTQPEALKLALGEAIAFHNGIGGARKEARLRYLRDYWADRLEALPGFRLLTSRDPKQSCGIGTWTISDFDMGGLSRALFDRNKIYTITVGIPSSDGGADPVIGMRVTPSIYTTRQELDLFVEAVSHYVRNGLPS